MTLRLVLLHSLLVPLCASTGAETSAERVFRKVGPSIVEISLLNGWGAGVVIREDGLILTNRHVADSILILAVKAASKRKPDAAMEASSFENVRLVAFHASLDLALLKVDAPGAQFAAVDLDSAPKVTTGMECFAIGMPTGQPSRKELNTSITRGIVSAARVSLPQGVFIQTDAPINPGNSGGALCSAHGEVIGIVTAKAEGAERIGFALPLSEIKLADFKNAPAGELPTGTLEDKVAKIEADLAIGHQSTGLDRANQLRAATRAYASLIRQHGVGPKFLKRLGELHLDLEDRQTAISCFERVLLLDPSNPGARWLYGAIAWDDGQRDLALTRWIPIVDAGAERWAEDSHSVALCLTGVGQALLAQGRSPAACYCFLWARAVFPDATKLRLFPANFEALLAAAITEAPALADLRGAGAAYSAKSLAELKQRVPGRDRADRYATALDQAGLTAKPTHPEPVRIAAPLSLPAGASKIRLQAPRPGMALDETASRVIWNNPPPNRGQERVLVLYDLGGRTSYAIVVFPEIPLPSDSGKLKVSDE